MPKRLLATVRYDMNIICKAMIIYPKASDGLQVICKQDVRGSSPLSSTINIEPKKHLEITLSAFIIYLQAQTRLLIVVIFITFLYLLVIRYALLHCGNREQP